MISNIERFSEERGLQKGRKEGLKEGLKKGRKEGVEKALHGAILGILRIRFRRVPRPVGERLAAIRNVPRLRRLHEQAVLAESLPAFETKLGAISSRKAN